MADPQVQRISWKHKPTGSTGTIDVEVVTPRNSGESQEAWDARHDTAVTSRLTKYPANV